MSPGVVETPMGRLEMTSTEGMSEIATGCALGRIGRAEEVATVIRFLCSEQASYLTGTDILVDGGAVAVFG